MTSTEANITASVAENTRLVQVLDETSYATSALNEQREYLEDLNTNVAIAEKELRKWEENVQANKKEHEKYQSSTVRRFAFKVSGKKLDFESKVSEGERAYFDAIQESLRVKSRLESIKEQVPDARARYDQLTNEVNRNREAQSQLDQLYDSIFGGPNPSFPAEDDAELAFEEARHAHNEAESSLANECRCLNLLKAANVSIYNCKSEALTAHSRSSMDMFGIGGAWADLSERSHLSQAQDYATRALTQMRQARKVQPLVPDLPPIEIANGNVLGDIVFDNIFSDYNFHRKIEATLLDITRWNNLIVQEVKRGQEREMAGRKQFKASKLDMERKREALQRVRMEMFERVAAQNGALQQGLPPPPPLVDHL